MPNPSETTNEFDVERLIDIIDQALISDDPRVRDALRNLMVIVTLTMTQEDGSPGPKVGPLRQFTARIKALEQQVDRLEARVSQQEFNARADSPKYSKWSNQSYGSKPWPYETLAPNDEFLTDFLKHNLSTLPTNKKT